MVLYCHCQRLIDRFVFVIENDKTSQVLYHINIKYQELREKVSLEEYRLIEEELRSTILKVGLIDSQIKLPSDQGTSYHLQHG